MPCSLLRSRRGLFYWNFMDRNRRNEIIDIVDGILADTEYACLEVLWQAHERLLQIFIEAEKTVLIDDCVLVTRLINEDGRLDEVVTGQFRMEVSSPGVERPLRTIAHFEEVIGARIHVDLTEKVNNRKQSTGVLKTVSDKGLLIEIDGRILWEVPIHLLNSANLVYDW